jgi:phosphoglycolate phosphatase
MTIRGILFDKDGTLLDYHATWMPLNERVALEAAGGDAARAHALLVAGGLVPETGRIRSGTVLAAGTNAEIAAFWHPMLGPGAPALADMVEMVNRVFEAGGAETATAVGDLAGLFARLKGRGLRLGVATSDSERGAHNTLGRFGVIEYLDFVAGYDSGHGTKPSAGMVTGFLAATGLGARDVMVVGDNPHDLEMGRAAAAGLVVGVLTGTSGRADLAALADHVLDSILEIESLL